jgi:DNA recombination protein RmuC
MLPGEIPPLLTPALVALAALVVAALVVRSGRRAAERVAAPLETLTRLQERVERALREEIERVREDAARRSHELREEVTGALRMVGDSLDRRGGEIRTVLDERLRSLEEENQKKLDEMRATVDEKLQGTLEKRLGESFKQVSERLEAVHQGLGEMQALAHGVGDLKRVLTNVRSRGTWGEVQLGTLLEQVLSPGQYERNVATRRGGAERVEFAIRLPGAEEAGDPVWLPIDAKFPLEDYQRLVEAQEAADAAAAEEAGRAVESRVKAEARRIRDKYVNPPSTTDFAILFIPTEGLYAEILRRPGLAEQVQIDCRVTLAGPTTLAAMLNSLQMGFRTLAIQKRSGEVWKLLGAVKTQFSSFGEQLTKVQEKLDDASKTLGRASHRSRIIERRLGRVEALPDHEAALLLPQEAEGGDDGARAADADE